MNIHYLGPCTRPVTNDEVRRYIQQYYNEHDLVRNVGDEWVVDSRVDSHAFPRGPYAPGKGELAARMLNDYIRDKSRPFHVVVG
jgi:hypothetical protein